MLDEGHKVLVFSQFTSLLAFVRQHLDGLGVQYAYLDGSTRDRAAVVEKFQTDPHWRDYVLFYEYFHGDNGAGLGASHQTGWTGLAAKLIELYGFLDPERALAMGKSAAFEPGARGRSGRRVP